MLLARCDTPDGPVVAIGIPSHDLRVLEQQRVSSFALADAGIDGPGARDRVLILAARPDEVQLMHHGYFPGVTDARIVLVLDHDARQYLRRGGAMTIPTPQAGVPRFVLFLGDTREGALAALRSAGIRARPKAAPTVHATPGVIWARPFNGQPQHGTTTPV